MSGKYGLSYWRGWLLRALSALALFGSAVEVLTSITHLPLDYYPIILGGAISHLVRFMLRHWR